VECISGLLAPAKGAVQGEVYQRLDTLVKEVARLCQASRSASVTPAANCANWTFRIPHKKSDGSKVVRIVATGIGICNPGPGEIVKPHTLHIKHRGCVILPALHNCSLSMQDALAGVARKRMKARYPDPESVLSLLQLIEQSLREEGWGGGETSSTYETTCWAKTPCR